MMWRVCFFWVGGRMEKTGWLKLWQGKESLDGFPPSNTASLWLVRAVTTIVIRLQLHLLPLPLSLGPYIRKGKWYTSQWHRILPRLLNKQVYYCENICFFFFSTNRKLFHNTTVKLHNNTEASTVFLIWTGQCVLNFFLPEESFKKSATKER